MQTTPEWATRPSLIKSELCEHLSISCYETLEKVLTKTDLQAVSSAYPWRRIFRAIHGTEGALLPGYLVELKARLGTPQFAEIDNATERARAKATAQGSTIIDDITDLEAELKEPLWSFDVMARALGKKPDTLSKALRQGRTELPIKTITLGPRLRFFRPLEVRLWRDDNILLDLPPALCPAVPAAKSTSCSASTERQQEGGKSQRGGDVEPESPNPTGPESETASYAEQVKKAVFGGR